MYFCPRRASPVMNPVEQIRSDLIRGLPIKEQRGSKPRCHFLTYGDNGDVARRLTTLIGPYGHVSPSDAWMPRGFDDTEEAQLHLARRLIHASKDRKALKDWWLTHARPTSRTPTWDIASTCTIGGRRGLLLVEAKAHCAELLNEVCGKRWNKFSNSSNHLRIALAIAEANLGLHAATDSEWRLSSDYCYQMSNRFAWAWKLCTLGYSVTLVYLGFLQANDMQGSFQSEEEWERLVRQHSECLFPAQVWEQPIHIQGSILVPLVRTLVQPLG
jgi:hypothetical protein